MSDLQWQIFEVLIDFVECFILQLFVQKLYGDKYTGWRKTLGFFVFWMAAVAQLLFFEQFYVMEGLTSLLGIAINITYAGIFLNGKLGGKIYSAFLIMAVNFCLSVLTNYMIGFFAGRDFIAMITTQDYVRVIYFIAAKAPLYYIMTVFIRNKPQKRLTSAEWAAVIIIPAMSVVLMSFIVDLTIPAPYGNIIGFVLTLVVLSFNIVIYYLYRKVNAGHEAELKSMAAHQYIEDQKKYISDSVLVNTHRSNHIHDSKNQWYYACGLVTKGRTDDLKKYVFKIFGIAVSLSNALINTNNPDLNTVVQIQLHKCQKAGICLHHKLEADLSGVEDYHLATMIPNLIDNALESCVNQGTKDIWLQTYRDKGCDVIRVKNKVPKSVIAHNPDLLTTKKDKRMHGVGLASVKDAASAYGGRCYFFEDDGYFIAIVELPIK